jgi:hypothetical protein
MDFFELEKVAIVIVALIMAYAEFKQGLMYRKRWLKFGLAFMGLYWAAYYTYSILRGIFDLQFAEHQIFVRSGILMTLALVGSGAWMTLHELRSFTNDS